ncbi:uncharacterized protein [Henckelia pumila]|uniref:uncharacterized protein n=1 Tax=Henckelia pumila TaxID=405737 RepID=UPI003C6E690F
MFPLILSDKYGTTNPIQTKINVQENRHVYVPQSPCQRALIRVNSNGPIRFQFSTGQNLAPRLYILEGSFAAIAESKAKQFPHTSSYFSVPILIGDMTVTAEVQKATAEKKAPAVKEKKPKAAAKVKKPKVAKTSSHPPYFEMIKEALLALNEKGGSSPYAIAKYMEEKHKSVLPENFRKILGLQLKNSTAKGKLIKVKASFKLSDAGKKGNPKPTPKPAAKKPAAVVKKTAATTKKPKATAVKATAATVGTKRKAATKKTEGVKKVAPKKAAAPKPKQPKSIKSPAAKKTKRARA